MFAKFATNSHGLIFGVNNLQGLLLTNVLPFWQTSVQIQQYKHQKKV